MRILHYSTDDLAGGAAKAAYRLHVAMRAAGHHSTMRVRRKQSDDADVVQVRKSAWLTPITRLGRNLGVVKPPRATRMFNFDADQGFTTKSMLTDRRASVDLICLHWVTTFLTTRNIKAIYEYFRRPIAWVLMDQEPLTGGCHYSEGCTAFKQACGSCPQLQKSWPEDASRVVWQNKQKYLAPLPITFIAPSSWAEQRLRESSLFGQHPVKRIPLAVDTQVFQPGDRALARAKLQIPLDKKVIFCGAAARQEPRKGFVHLVEALRQLPSLLAMQGSRVAPADVFLLTAGRGNEESLAGVPFAGRELGYISDEQTLLAAYQAADLFACPSVEDAGPMMLAESMLCGTPAVAFPTGSAPDLIVSGENGYLARLGAAHDLALGLFTLLNDPQVASTRQRAQHAALRLHDPAAVVKQFEDLQANFQSGRRLAA